MKYDTRVNETGGSLEIAGSHLNYRRESGAAMSADFALEKIGRDDFSVLVNGRSFRVSMLPGGKVSVNGRVFQVEIIDQRSLRGRTASGERGGRRSIAAPMPGRVIRVLVEAGQTVEAGQGLIVVEAMKMQNEIKAPRAGVIMQVKTAAGATVAAGDVLLVME